jgi:hypothetical protein
MICSVEIFHYLPVALIALSLFSATTKASRALTSAVVSGLSILGLTAGAHMHVGHGEIVTAFDPCVGYLIALTIALTVCGREIAMKLASK